MKYNLTLKFFKIAGLEIEECYKREGEKNVRKAVEKLIGDVSRELEKYFRKKRIETEIRLETKDGS